MGLRGNNWLQITNIIISLLTLAVGGFVIYFFQQNSEESNRQKDICRLSTEMIYNQKKVQEMSAYFGGLDTEWRSGSLGVHSFEYKKVAFEVLKLGAIREMDDCRDAIELIYINLEELKYHSDWYFQAKKEIHFAYIIKPNRIDNEKYEANIKRLNTSMGNGLEKSLMKSERKLIV